MGKGCVGGYAGRLLRADLGSGHVSDLIFEEAALRKWINHKTVEGAEVAVATGLGTVLPHQGCRLLAPLVRVV